MDRFLICAARTGVAEGGYVNHPRDPGGPTNHGVTQATLSDWYGRKASTQDVRNLLKSTAHEIFRENYWDPAQCSRVPVGLDYALFDFAINSGVSRAVKELQKVLGVTADGIVGLQTLNAIDHTDLPSLIERYCAARLAFMKRLKTWPTFKNGWKTRVDNVVVASLADAVGYEAEPLPAVFEDEAEQYVGQANDDETSVLSKLGDVKGLLASATAGIGAITSLNGTTQVVVAVGVLAIVAYLIVKHERD